MRNLWEALPSGRRGGYADTSAQLESQVTAAIRAGDTVMVKGSLGSKMKLIATALERRFPQADAGDDGEGAGHGAAE
jgi:UDP-N-acetylmuramoyl-tripeptide--D-alanyl-D-alanine ligase